MPVTIAERPAETVVQETCISPQAHVPAPTTPAAAEEGVLGGLCFPGD